MWGQELDPIQWLDVLRICQDPIVRDFFIATNTNEGRRAVIELQGFRVLGCNFIYLASVQSIELCCVI